MKIQQLKQLSIIPVIAGIATIEVIFSPVASSAPAFRNATTIAGIASTKEETFSVSWVDFKALPTLVLTKYCELSN